MKKSLWLLLIVLLVSGLVPLTSQAAPLTKLSWRAEYYDNNSLSGAPKLSIYEANLDHDWGHGSPAPEIPADYFSARYTITRHFEKGTYMFFLTADDGARLWLDGQLLIDAWDVGFKKRQTKIYLDTSGDHEIQVAYFENTGKALVKLSWDVLASDDQVVGAWSGEYFINPNLAGTPTITRQDSAINFDWNSGSPDPRITRDNFSIRWTRKIYLKGGVYRFKIQHDDGMRLYVDGKIFYDSWYDQAVTYQVRDVPIKGGLRTFTVEFYDHIGNAVAYVSFDGDPDGYQDLDADPGSVVDEQSGRFTWNGPAYNRYTGPGGYGSSYWTYNGTSNVINSGTWSLPISSAGNYEIFAFIPGSNATTTAAHYSFCHYGQQDSRVINQSQHPNKWVSLGIYHFAGDGTECVTLYDTTGEAAGSTQVAFDAIKFVKR